MKQKRNGYRIESRVNLEDFKILKKNRVNVAAQIRKLVELLADDLRANPQREDDFDWTLQQFKEKSTEQKLFAKGQDLLND